MKDDWKTELVYPHGKGGQHAGSPPSEIKVTHMPTGLTATCGYERSQNKNRNVAILMIEYGLAELGLTDPEQHDKPDGPWL